MHILNHTYAVFWTRKEWLGSRVAFHADQAATSPSEAYGLFSGMFPNDIVRSIRGKDGRFCSFK